jgi:hypothetical protein
MSNPKIITTKSFLTCLTKSWKKISSDLVTEAIESFENKIPILDFNNTKIDGIPANYGVYCFYINSQKKNIPTKNFIDFWDNIKYSPNLNKTRFSLAEELDFQPIYIGKSENLKSRIHEHCFQIITSSTYGMKLSHRKNILTNYDIYVGYFDIKKEENFSKAAMQFIITNLESELRKTLNPWIGKQ